MIQCVNGSMIQCSLHQMIQCVNGSMIQCSLHSMLSPVAFPIPRDYYISSSVRRNVPLSLNFVLRRMYGNCNFANPGWFGGPALPREAAQNADRRQVGECRVGQDFPNL